MENCAVVENVIENVIEIVEIVPYALVLPIMADPGSAPKVPIVAIVPKAPGLAVITPIMPREAIETVVTCP